MGAEGPPAELSGRGAETASRCRVPAGAAALPREPGAAVLGAPALPDALAASAPGEDGAHMLTTLEPTRLLFELTRWATEQGIVLEELSVSRASLEDIYLELTAGAPALEREA